MASKFLKITSPRGEAFYAYLKNPEMYDGEVVGLTIQAKFSQADTDKLIAQLEKELNRAKGDAQFKDKKWAKEPFLGYREKDNGDIIFKFKTKHEFKKGDEVIKRTVPVYDSKGRPIDVNIGNGSIIRVAFQVVPYWKSLKNNGLTLFMDAIQVIELKEYSGGADADAFGFEEEDGYEAGNSAEVDRFDDDITGDQEVDSDQEF